MERPQVFVATGTGIAPFVSFVKMGVENLILLHAVSSVSKLYYNEPPFGPYDFYLCGSGAMVRDALQIIDVSFPDSRIFSEMFFPHED